MFSTCIRKIKFKYSPEDFKNPALQKLWYEIEAIALAREESEPVVDLTLPNNDNIENRAGNILTEFADNCGLAAGGASSAPKRKTKASDKDEDSKPSKKAKSDSGPDVEFEAQNGRVSQSLSSLFRSPSLIFFL